MRALVFLFCIILSVRFVYHLLFPVPYGNFSRGENRFFSVCSDDMQMTVVVYLRGHTLSDDRAGMQY